MSPDPHLITARSSPCPPLPLLFYCFSPFFIFTLDQFRFSAFYVRLPLLVCPSVSDLSPLLRSTIYFSVHLLLRISFPLSSPRFPSASMHLYPSFISSQYSSFHLIPSSSLPVIVTIPRTVSVSFLASSPPLCRLSSVASEIPRVPQPFIDIHLEFFHT